MRYLIVIEQTVTGFSACLPDVSGCIDTGDARDDAEREMKGAIAFHLDGLRAEGMAVRQPSSSSSYVEIRERLNTIQIVAVTGRSTRHKSDGDRRL